jgi:hypothetical protein
MRNVMRPSGDGSERGHRPAADGRSRDTFLGRLRLTNNTRTISLVRRPEPLRSVTLRLRASVADALRRESIKRSRDHVEPFPHQVIVKAALCAWLTDQGCRLDD